MKLATISNTQTLQPYTSTLAISRDAVLNEKHLLTFKSKQQDYMTTELQYFIKKEDSISDYYFWTLGNYQKHGNQSFNKTLLIHVDKYHHSKYSDKV